MKTITRIKVLSFLLIAAYFLAACGGTLPTSIALAQAPKVQANVVAFSGVVEAMNGSDWTVGGQKFTLGSQAAIDPNIVLGDEVRVEANVSADGAVVALKVETTKNDDSSTLAASSTPDPVSSPEAASTPGAPVAGAGSANQNEIFGTVQAMNGDMVTVDGLTYRLSNQTEFKNTIGLGDQVKLHVTVNPDGSLTIREIERAGASLNDNSGSSGADDGLNHDANDDHSRDDSGHDANDDHGGDSGNRGSGSDD
jgi:hypothetical protein